MSDALGMSSLTTSHPAPNPGGLGAAWMAGTWFSANKIRDTEDNFNAAAGGALVGLFVGASSEDLLSIASQLGKQPCLAHMSSILFFAALV